MTRITLVFGLASSLTLGGTHFAMADEDNNGSPESPVPIEEQIETPDPAETPEPIETPEPSDFNETPEPADLNETPDGAPQDTTPAIPEFEPEISEPVITPPAVTPPTETVTPTVEVTDSTTTPTVVSQPQAVACRVVVVDRVAQTITVEAEGQLHLLKMDPQAKIMKKGKLVTLDDVVPGQEIVVLARTTSEGVIQVVSLAIGPAKGKEQTASSGNSTGKANVNAGFNFPSYRNPANLGPVAPAPLTPAPVVTPNS